MKFLIVYAHPEPRSFNGALFERAVESLGAMGHEVLTSDLYGLGFDPVSDRRNFLGAKDAGFFKQQDEERHASGAPGGGFSPDIEREWLKLDACDALILQFPLWWFGVPAVLKGWMDRVYASGRAYGGEVGIYDETPFYRRGKRAMLSFTTGGPASAYSGEGIHPRLEQMLLPVQRGCLQFVGFQVLPPFVAWGAAHGDDASRAQMLDALEERLREWDSTEPIPFLKMAEANRRRFEVQFSFRTPFDPALRALQAARVNELKRDNLVFDLRLRADHGGGSLELRARDEAQVRAALESLPLHPHTDWKIFELEPLQAPR